MIPRYEQKEISYIWQEQEKYHYYLKVEIALLEALEELGSIPRGTSQAIKEKASIKVDRIYQIEEITKHDILAFCESITEQLPAEISKFFHFGVTSSDIIDTSLNLQIKDSLQYIIQEMQSLLKTLKDLSLKYKDLLCIGRSHGMYAEPTSFGLKFLHAYAQFERRYQELLNYSENHLKGQLSGPVGNYPHLSPEVEARALKKLGLQPEAVSTQVIARDHIALLVSLNAISASCIESIATEIRHLHRSEVSEVSEGFSKGQKGSSAMPHKKNPIACENLTGMARVLRSHVLIALENICLWHERDISHSSTERIYLPDHLGLMLYSLKRLNKTLQNLEVHQETIKARVTDNFEYLSSYVLHELVKNCQATREQLYRVIQQSVFQTKSGDQNQDKQKAYIQNLSANLKKEGISYDFSKLMPLDEKSIAAIYLKNISSIYQRVLKEKGV